MIHAKHYSALGLFLVVLLSLQACKNPERLVDRGRYDEAIDIAVRRLGGKSRKKAALVSALERALSKANERNLSSIEYLKKEGKPENWEAINLHYRHIMARQRQIKPLLPLIDDQGRRANIQLVDVGEKEMQSKKKAAEVLYATAERLMKRARQDDRFAAREAYGNLRKIENYYQSYRDKDRLVNEARQLGMTRILVQMRNQTNLIIPEDFQRELLRISVRELNHDWLDFSLGGQENARYDYASFINVVGIDVSPEQLQERTYTDSKEIQDGTEVVRDSRGNISRDSSGNEITQPHYETITCQVIERRQFKAAAVTANLEIFDNRRKEMIKRIPLQTDAVFENYAGRFNGDRRALSPESQSRIGNEMLPFPPDEVLIIQAAELLKPMVKDAIIGNRNLFR